MKDFIDLFAGSFEDFRNNYWEKKPYKFIQINKSTFFIGIKEIEKILSLHSLDKSVINVVSSNKKIGKKLFQGRDLILNKGVISHLYNSGDTIIIEKADNINKKLFSLSRQLENSILTNVGINIYISPTFSSSGFNPHYDTHDIFIFQLYGKKRWHIFDDPVGLPKSNEPFIESNHKNYFIETPSSEFDMEEGDILYLPRGWVHNAFTLDKESIHMTVGIHRSLNTTYSDVNTKYFLGSKVIDIHHPSNLFNINDEINKLWNNPNLLNNIFDNRIVERKIDINSTIKIEPNFRFKVTYFEDSFKVETASHEAEFPNECLPIFENIIKYKKVNVNSLSKDLHENSIVSIVAKLFKMGVISVQNKQIESTNTTKLVDLNRKYFFPISPNGEISNPTNNSLISTLFRPIIDKISSLIKKKYSKYITSLYIRGSVPIGFSDINSDIDLILIVKNTKKLESIHEELKEIYSKISINIYSNKHALNNKLIIFTLKTQSLLLYGIDIVQSEPVQKICTENLLLLKNYASAKIYFLGSISREVESIKTMHLVSSLMKHLLRVGFEFVMLRENKFTREIVTCYKSIVKYYPSDAIFFYQILYLAVNPTINKNIIHRIIDKFDEWLIKENGK